MGTVVAVIDEGILPPGEGILPPGEGRSVEPGGKDAAAIEEIGIAEFQANISRQKEGEDKRLHGNNVAAIIRQADPLAQILSVKLEPRHVINVPLLCQALRYCAGRDDVGVINISLGIRSVDPSPELRDSCRECHEKGKIIVAAAHYDCDRPCFPAAFPFVYGVGIGMLRNIRDFAYVGEGYINVIAKGIHQRVVGENGRQVMRGGTSYAAAAFSGILSGKLRELAGDTGDPVHQWIRQGRAPGHCLHYLRRPAASPGTGGLAGTVRDTGGMTRDTRGTAPDSRGWLLYAVDDPKLLQAIAARRHFVCAMRYFQGPVGRDGLTGIREVEPILSKKIFDRVDTLVLDNYFKNQYLTNVYFAYALMDLFAVYDGNFIIFDAYIAGIVEEVVRKRNGGYRGHIDLLSKDSQTFNLM